jgi:ubiquinone/menaquinone biosynthesis C-methylase UbiE
MDVRDAKWNMPVVPNFLERLGILNLNLTNAMFLDLVSTGGFRTVRAASNLGVFDALSVSPMTSQELASKLGADSRAIGLLLEALYGFGYVGKHGDRYYNSKLTEKWLTSASPASQVPAIDFYHDILFELWEDVENSIRTGKPSLQFEEWLSRDTQRWRRYMEFSVSIARAEAPQIVSKVKLPKDAARLLDIGGGHGYYSMAFCKKYPHLSATIFDREEALKVAREVAEMEGMRQRIVFQAGDFMTDELGEGYDVVLAFGFLHQYSPEDLGKLFAKVYRCLRAGGMFVIKHEPSDKMWGNTRKVWLKFQGLNYFTLYGGQTHSFSQLSQLLIRARFANLRQIKFLMTVSSIVTAKKPDQ